MRRRRSQPSSLISLLDVLFILVFASMAQAASLRESAEESRAAEPEVTEPEIEPVASIDAGAADAGSAATRDELRLAALETLEQSLRERTAIFVRVSATGIVTAIERGTSEPEIALTVPLVERVADPNVRLDYSGRLDPEQRICSLVRRELGLDSLADYLIVIVPSTAIYELPVALALGLRRDAEECMAAADAPAAIVPPHPGASRD